MNPRLKTFGKRIAKAFRRKYAAPNPAQEGVHEFVRTYQPGNRKTTLVIYKKEFRKFLRANRGIVRDFMEARRQSLSSPDSAPRRGKLNQVLWQGRVGKLKVALLNTYRQSWKVEFENRAFFVKETRVGTDHSGPLQFKAYSRLEKLLEKNPELAKHIELAKYHMGWGVGGSVFLVTDFYDLEDNPRGIPIELDKAFDKFSEKAEKARVGEVRMDQTFYDKARNKLIVFDPILRPYVRPEFGRHYAD